MALGLESLATAYGLASALAWGASDFWGGYASRRAAVLGVILRSQLIGGAFLLILALVFSSGFPPLGHFLLGGLAGIFGVLGLVALYMGLARGRMGIVAPISALVTAFIPVIFSFFREGLPPPTKLIGFALALIAVWLLSADRSEPGFSFNELLLPLLAGTGFGLYFVLIDQGTSESILWPLVGARGASLCLVGGLLLFSDSSGGISGRDLPFIVLAGVFDALGNLFFALAANLGRLDVSAVLASLYPAATVILAWAILKERLRMLQWAGVLSAAVGLILISI